MMRRVTILTAALVSTGCSAVGSGSANEASQAGGAIAERFAPGVISDARWQYRITFTPDGRTAYYTASDSFFPASRRATIMVSQLLPTGAWTAPVTAPFSGVHTDIDPFISPDGQRLFFSSIRPENGTARPDLDIFVMERSSSGWGEPQRLGREVNSAQDELYASQAADGTLFFASGPFGPTPNADWDIFSSARVHDGFAQRQPIAAVNTDLPFDPANPTADWEFNPEVSADGRTLLFASLRPGGYGFGDLYVSRYVNGEWTAPANLGPAVNTAQDEFHPTLSRDGRTLYFARTIITPSLVPADFYRIAVSALGVPLR